MARFLFLVGSLKKGGAERNTAWLANMLVRNGHQVSIACFIPRIDFPLDKEVNVVRIDHKRFGKDFLNVIYILYRLRRLIAKVKPTRLIAMSRVAGLLVASAFFPGTIVRFDIYPLVGYRKYKQRQFWFFYNLPWVSKVVCPSDELRKDVTRFFLKKRKLVTIYNPIPADSGHPSEQVHTRPFFLVVSRIVRQKNIDKIIQAYHDSAAWHKVDLLILGDGPERDTIAQLTGKLNLGDHVHAPGFVSDPKPYMQQAVALISASLREGFPNGIVESLYYGTPVISSRAKTGPAEIIFHGKNGLLFDVGDYEMLKTHMNAVLSDETLYHALKQNASLGLDRFAPDLVFENWQSILLNE